MEDNGEVFRVVTANRLRDGAIVYLRLGADGQMDWVQDIRAANAFDEHEIEDVVKRAEQAIVDRLVVDVYATEVAGRNRPLSAREMIRAKGPSIRYGHAAIEPDFSI